MPNLQNPDNPVPLLKQQIENAWSRMRRAAAADRLGERGAASAAPFGGHQTRSADYAIRQCRAQPCRDGSARHRALASAVVLLAGGPVVIGPRRRDCCPPRRRRAHALTTWAMHWFTEMMAGRTDRSQYAPAFVAQVTDEAVARCRTTSTSTARRRCAPKSCKTEKEGDQTFTIVKFVFPRGDATSLLFGFDAAGKITGIAVGGMAGTDRKGEPLVPMA